jgi:hypothetical protein
MVLKKPYYLVEIYPDVCIKCGKLDIKVARGEHLNCMDRFNEASETETGWQKRKH